MTVNTTERAQVLVLILVHPTIPSRPHHTVLPRIMAPSLQTYPVASTNLFLHLSLVITPVVLHTTLANQVNPALPDPPTQITSLDHLKALINQVSQVARLTHLVKGLINRVNLVGPPTIKDNRVPLNLISQVNQLRFNQANQAPNHQVLHTHQAIQTLQDHFPTSRINHR